MQGNGKMKLTDRQHKLLRELCTAEPGKGYMLKPEARRVAGPLLNSGYVMWIGFGKIRVYSATDAGRAALQQDTQP
jgi:hypothetical protein